jgi:hypothetical protein
MPPLPPHLSPEQIKAFRLFLLDKCGNLRQALAELDVHDRGWVNCATFQDVVSGRWGYCSTHEARLLFTDLTVAQTVGCSDTTRHPRMLSYLISTDTVDLGVILHRALARSNDRPKAAPARPPRVRAHGYSEIESRRQGRSLRLKEDPPAVQPQVRPSVSKPIPLESVGRSPSGVVNIGAPHGPQPFIGLALHPTGAVGNEPKELRMLRVRDYAAYCRAVGSK